MSVSYVGASLYTEMAGKVEKFTEICVGFLLH